MATISITTDYKFNKKSAQKLLDAMDKSEKVKKINETTVRAKKIKNQDEINSILRDF